MVGVFITQVNFTIKSGAIHILKPAITTFDLSETTIKLKYGGFR